MAFPGGTFPNSCNRAPLQHFLPTPQRMRASTGLHTPSKAHFPRGPRGPIRRTEYTPPTSFHTSSGKVSTAQTSFDCPNVRFMQNRCHVRITGCSSFLTFHAGVESVGPLSRDRRPLKRNQLQKKAGFFLLKTGARPKRNLRRDISLCSCRDVGS